MADYRPSLKTGSILGGIALAVEALAILPGRITLGHDQDQLGRSPFEFVVAGTLRDLSDVALPLAVAITLALLVTTFVRRPLLLRTFIAALGIAATLLWLTSSSAAEYKLQRGVDATWLDLQLGSKNLSVGSTFLGFIVLRRHWVPALGALVAVTAVLLGVRARPWKLDRPFVSILGFNLAIVLGWVSALVPLDPHVRVFRTLGDRHIVGEPFVSLFAGLGRSQGNVRLGMRGLLESAKFPAEVQHGGEALLGLPTLKSQSVDCRAHPLGRLLPIAGAEPARSDVIGEHALDPSAKRVLELLDQLGEELYRDRTRPIDVWHVMLESFRGDDVHALSPDAPRELAPFMNSLFESRTIATPVVGPRSAGPPADVIAVRRMWQAGARTSQGLSSYLCGMGMLPYGLSVTRDLGFVPLRCLPDLLVDANFDTSFLYGGPPSFDEMDAFLRQHSVRDIVGRQQFPLTAPTSEGGVSDRALVAHAAERALSRAGDRGRYHLVMTQSNHVPYRRPDDVPPEIDTRVEKLVQLPGFAGTTDDVRRLTTFAYADHALSELYAGLARDHDRSIFIFGADHATSDRFVWPHGPDWNRNAAQAQIPFVIVIPERLTASSPHPERIRQLVQRLNEMLDHHAWSQNDVPLFLLTLLSHAPGIQSLPSDRRWHTLGGERTSPFFRPPRDDVKILGIDCMSEFFGMDEHDQRLLPPETASFVKSASEIYTSCPSLIPVAASLSRFLKGYAAQCPSALTR